MNFKLKVQNMIKVAEKIETESNFIEQVISSLSFYIGEVDENYLYNETYLSDYTNEYLNSLNRILVKRQLLDDVIEKFKKEIHSKTLVIKNMKIEFDNIWCFKITDNKFSQIDILDNGSIKSLNKKNTYVAIYIYENEEILTEDYYSFYTANEFVNYVIDFYKRVGKVDRG